MECGIMKRREVLRTLVISPLVKVAPFIRNFIAAIDTAKPVADKTIVLKPRSLGLSHLGFTHISEVAEWPKNLDPALTNSDPILAKQICVAFNVVQKETGLYMVK